MPGPALIGLTGSIAAGKSEALRILGELGAATISADAVVHDLLATGAVRESLRERWGTEVAPGAEVDRGRVAAIVFSDPEELTWLEGLLHPLVGEEILDWREALRPQLEVAVAEIPLLFEGSMEEMFDATVAIVAAEGERAERAARRGIADLEARSARQLSEAEKIARATHAIRNDGTLADLERQLRDLFPALAAAR